MYRSLVHLVASMGYELTGIGMLDSFGALGIAALSFKEGRGTFEKAKGNSMCACQGSCK
ncbi:Co/Zn/Cd cation transporter-like protein (fragment) [Candidatus Sulfobium mesophilum]|uniref:Co/Zn/Cd cation transporter-like protein n=1 Tax=Candidatus Sulfobium mesophilum TaxID=2016548 RepID=A0A2U3QIA3_9BACT